MISADERILLLARNTLWLSVGACLVSLPPGTLLAFLLARTDLPLRRFAWLVVLVFLFLPLYLHAAAWDAGFGKLGWYSLARQSLDTPLLRGWAAAIWIQGLWSIPWVTVIVAVVLRMCEPELEEEALLDATARRVFAAVTLRRALPGIVVAGLWVALITAGEMTVTDLYQIRTLAEELYNGFALSMGDEPAFGIGTALALTGLLVGVALIAMDLLVVAAEHVPTRPPFCFRLGRWRTPTLVLVVVMLILLAGVPLWNLIDQAGTIVRQVDGQPVRDWSAGQFREVLIPLPGAYRNTAIWAFSDVFIWTVLIGSCAASLAFVVGVLLGWWARRGRWHVLPAAVIASLGLATMGPLIGLALIALFALGDQVWLDWFAERTIAAPVLAATARALPLPIMISYVAFRTINREALDAATLEGAGGLTQLWHLGIRQRKMAMLTAWLVAFAVSCGELSATILVVPAGITTVPIRVFRLLHTGVRNQVAAICLTSMFGFFVIAVVVTLLGPLAWRSHKAGVHGVSPPGGREPLVNASER